LDGVAEIMAGAANGETMRRISEHMQALNVKLRRGKRWNPGTVWRVIRRQEFLKGKEAKPDMVHISEIAFYPSALASAPTDSRQGPFIYDKMESAEFDIGHRTF